MGLKQAYFKVIHKLLGIDRFVFFLPILFGMGTSFGMVLAEELKKAIKESKEGKHENKNSKTWNK